MHVIFFPFFMILSTRNKAFQFQFQSKVHLESSRTSAVKLFVQIVNVSRPLAIFAGAPSWMFDRILDATLSNNLLQLAEGLRRTFSSLGLHKVILDSPCFPILLIYTKHKTNRWNLWLTQRPISLFWNCASVLKYPTYHPQQHLNRTKTNHHWLNHLQILHTQ